MGMWVNPEDLQSMARHPHSRGSQHWLHFRITWRTFKILDVQAASKSESLGEAFRPRSFLKLPGTLNVWLRFRTTPFKALVPAKTSKTSRVPKSSRDLLMAQILVQ